MSKTAKRTRTIAQKTSATEITIRQVMRNGYLTHLVQGWKENDKWQRKFFTNETEAKTFASMKRISMENVGRQQHMILSSLTQDKHDEACRAFDALGIYSLTEAVKFYLANHRAPDYTIELSNAISRYIEDKESTHGAQCVAVPVRVSKYSLQKGTHSLNDSSTACSDEF